MRGESLIDGLGELTVGSQEGSQKAALVAERLGVKLQPMNCCCSYVAPVNQALEDEQIELPGQLAGSVVGIAVEESPFCPEVTLGQSADARRLERLPAGRGRSARSWRTPADTDRGGGLVAGRPVTSWGGLLSFSRRRDSSRWRRS